MKKQNDKRKLAINHQTIRCLDALPLSGIRGGVWPTDPQTNSQSCCATSL